MERNQTTVMESLTFVGKSIKTGKDETIRIDPAPVNTGIVFVKNNTVIPVAADNILYTNSAVVLGIDCIRIYGVEHLLSALHGVGIENARIELISGELPECMEVFAKVLYRYRKIQNEPSNRIALPTSCLVENEKLIVENFNLKSTLQITCSYSFDSSASGKPLFFIIDPEVYINYIANARTFCTRDHLNMLQSKGFAKGVDGSNCIIIDGEVSEKEKHEFTMHKIKDFIGDIFLLGFPVTGWFRLHNPTHTLTYKFINKLLEVGI